MKKYNVRIMNSEQGSTAVDYAVMLFLVLVVVVVLVALMFAGDAIGTGESIRKTDENVSKAAVAKCREVCYIAYGPGGNFENRENLAKCYEICGK